MASYDTGLSTIDDVKKEKNQSQSSSSDSVKKEPCLASDTAAACVSAVVQGAVLCAGCDVTADTTTTTTTTTTIYTAYEDAI
jgi:hypothetical protein